jgi:hypothetical protein
MANLPQVAIDILEDEIERELLGTLREIFEAKPFLSQTVMLVREHLRLEQPRDVTMARLSYPVFRQAMASDLDRARMELRRRVGEQRWPDWYDFRSRFTGLPAENACGLPHVLPVLDAPFVAAEIAVRGCRVEPETVQALRLYREFDSEWFNTAYPLALGLAVAQTGKHRS